MRFLSIHLPFLATDRIRRLQGSPARREERLRSELSSRPKRSGEPGTRERAPPSGSRTGFQPSGTTIPPLATWAKIGGAQQLAAVDSAALNAGLRPGMALASARAMRPDLELHQSAPQAEAELLAGVADWLRRFTPLAAMDAPDGAMLDIGGCAHLFGGEQAMIDAIERGLRAQGFQPRCAIAPNPALAWALARFSATRILAEDDHAGAARILRRLPVAALRVSGEIVCGLRTAGLTRVGDLLTRPRAPLAARFGTGLTGRLDAIVGAARDPISPRFEAAPYMAERRFAEGLARAQEIERVLADLSRDLCALLERHDEGARRIAASFFRVDGATRHIEATTSRPQRDPAALARLMREKIEALGEDGLDTGYGFDVIRLAATAVERTMRAPPTDLVGARADANDAHAFSDLIDRLGARFGTHRVQSLVFHDTHAPEFAGQTRPASVARSTPPGAARNDTEGARPPRLFEKPEPVEAMAAVPDGPPLRFKWRRTTHEIAAFEGPERIAPEWWRETGLTRDYFHVEDKNGGRFWLYREGLFGRETPHPRWFVHGVFG